jgi:hypothetical protein
MGIDTPPHISAEIEDIEEEIEQLQSELVSIEKLRDTRPLPHVLVNQTTDSVRPSPSKHKTERLESIIIPNSELIAKFHWQRNQIFAYIYNEYSLEVDGQMDVAFNELNIKRRRQGLTNYYRSTKFRLIAPPQSKATGIEFHLAPMDYLHLSLLEEQDIPVEIKEHVRDQIQQVANRIPKRLHSIHPVLNGRNYHPLGVEIAIVTQDKKTLLRRRSENVLLSTGKWDVSFSGYCDKKDKLSAGELDVALTVERELRNEIGGLAADPREIIFTGLHRNTETGATDILGFWEIEAKTDELVELLAEKYPGIKKAFETTKRAVEPFVWDSTNLIVDFDGPAISQALEEITMIPEAFTCLQLSLEATGYPNLELA